MTMTRLPTRSLPRRKPKRRRLPLRRRRASRRKRMSTMSHPSRPPPRPRRRSLRRLSLSHLRMKTTTITSRQRKAKLGLLSALRGPLLRNPARRNPSQSQIPRPPLSLSRSLRTLTMPILRRSLRLRKRMTMVMSTKRSSPSLRLITVPPSVHAKARRLPRRRLLQRVHGSRPATSARCHHVMLVHCGAS